MIAGLNRIASGIGWLFLGTIWLGICFGLGFLISATIFGWLYPDGWSTTAAAVAEASAGSGLDCAETGGSAPDVVRVTVTPEVTAPPATYNSLPGSEKRFLEGYPAPRPGGDVAGNPSAPQAASVNRCVVSATSAILKRLDELAELVRNPTGPTPPITYEAAVTIVGILLGVVFVILSLIIPSWVSRR